MKSLSARDWYESVLWAERRRRTRPGGRNFASASGVASAGLNPGGTGRQRLTEGSRQGRQVVRGHPARPGLVRRADHLPTRAVERSERACGQGSCFADIWFVERCTDRSFNVAICRRFGRALASCCPAPNSLYDRFNKPPHHGSLLMEHCL